MKTRVFLLTILIVLSIFPNGIIAQNGQNNHIRLIAHRGGIVDKNQAENSLAAIKEAIKREYWMLEIDLRESRDGRVLLHHDNTFKKYYNDSRKVSDMVWSDISQLQSEVDGSRPVLFKEVAELASEKINLMLDVKGNDFSISFYEKIEKILRNNNLLSSTYILSSSQAKNYFKGKAFLSIGFEALLEAAEAGEPVSSRYYLFELGSNLDKEKVSKANELDVRVVAAINEFRYVQANEDSWGRAKKDICRLIRMGVSYYQIDSIYEPLFNWE